MESTAIQRREADLAVLVAVTFLAMARPLPYPALGQNPPEPPTEIETCAAYAAAQTRYASEVHDTDFPENAGEPGARPGLADEIRCDSMRFGAARRKP